MRGALLRVTQSVAARRTAGAILPSVQVAGYRAGTAALNEGPVSKPQGNGLGKAAIVAAALAAGAVASSDVVSAKDASVDISKVKDAIADVIDDDNAIGPTFLRLAWHSSGSYSKPLGTGGSDGGTIRGKPEINYGGNAGLILAVNKLKPIKEKFPEISWADLMVLSGVTAIEEMGGPDVPFRLGRTDAPVDTAEPNDRLPDADKGDKDFAKDKKTFNHMRDVFKRMGFTDRDMVALIGAHAVGRCYTDRSGFSGPWTRAEWTFSNEFYRELLETKWTLKKWNGPRQYEDPSGDLMMLPSDMVCLWEPELRKYVEMYAKDEDLWFEDFTKAFVKLTENGVKFPKSGWRKLMFWS